MTQDQDGVHAAFPDERIQIGFHCVSINAARVASTRAVVVLGGHGPRIKQDLPRSARAMTGGLCVRRAPSRASGLAPLERQHPRRQGLARKASAAQRGLARHGFTLTQILCPGLGSHFDLLKRRGDHLPHRDFVLGLVQQIVRQMSLSTLQASSCPHA